MAAGFRIGIDLGGTKIEGAAVDASGSVPVRRRLATPAEDYHATIAAVATLVTGIERELGAAATVGIGMPGTISPATGLVKNANSTWLNGRPLRRDLEAALGRPVRLANDANCFALSEAVDGAAAGLETVFGVILGTGVGGGVVVHGRVWDGLHGVAGEWGHHGVWAGDPSARDCYCGQRGCLEAYASGPAVEAHYARLTGSRAPLAEIAKRRETDEGACVALDSLLDSLGRGLANVVDVLDPSAIVLGGGVSNLDLLYAELAPRMAKYVFNDELETPILRHGLGDSAGVVGAALRALGAS